MLCWHWQSTDGRSLDETRSQKKNRRNHYLYGCHLLHGTIHLLDVSHKNHKEICKKCIFNMASWMTHIKAKHQLSDVYNTSWYWGRYPVHGSYVNLFAFILTCKVMIKVYIYLWPFSMDFSFSTAKIHWTVMRPIFCAGNEKQISVWYTM